MSFQLFPAKWIGVAAAMSVMAVAAAPSAAPGDPPWFNAVGLELLLLPLRTPAAALSPAGDQVALVQVEPSHARIVVRALPGRNQVAVAELQMGDARHVRALAWPHPDWIVVWTDRGPLHLRARRDERVDAVASAPPATVLSATKPSDSRLLRDGDFADAVRLFPGRNVAMLGTDQQSDRALLRVSAADDPGRIFVYERATGATLEVARVAPALGRAQQPRVERRVLLFGADATVEVRITTPRIGRGERAPLVLWLPERPWRASSTDFDRAAHALAHCGFRVLEVFPTQDPESDVAIEEDVAELLARTLPQIQGQGQPSRMAILGTGAGGWLAFRLAQHRPELVRAVAAVDAFDDPFFRRTREAATVLRDPWQLKQPGPDGRISLFLPDSRNGFDHRLAHQPVLNADQSVNRLLPPPREARRHSVSLSPEMRAWLRGADSRSSRAVLDWPEPLHQPLLLLHDLSQPLGISGDLKPLLRRPRHLDALSESWDVPRDAQGRSALEQPAVLRRIGTFLHAVHARYEVEIGPAQPVQP